MRDDLTVKVELEAEDTLAVRLKSLHMEGPEARGSNLQRAVLTRRGFAAHAGRRPALQP